MNKIVDLLTYALMIGGIFVMTKNANGANLVKAATGGFVHIEQAATGQKTS